MFDTTGPALAQTGGNPVRQADPSTSGTPPYHQWMILPIWVASWEIECCQPDATVGEPWAAPFVLLMPPEPWWIEYVDIPPPAEVMELGVVELDGEVTSETTAEHPGVFQADTLRVVVRSPLTFGTRELRGRLSFEGHDGPGMPDKKLKVGGTVRRVRGIPLRYELRDRRRVPIGQDDALDIESTIVRGLPEFLVDLELNPSLGAGAP